MKANRTLCFPAKICSFIMLSLSGYYQLSAQKFIYDFESPVLQTAASTDLKVGAIYLFSKVSGTTDALVKITAISGNVTISAIDNAGQGYAQAFQPTLHIPLATVASPKINTYAEFSITFIATGSYNKTTGAFTSLTQSNVPATALDIDGTFTTTAPRDSLFEYDLLDLGTNSYPDYSTTGGQLTISRSGTTITGQTHTATNYSGIDTTATAVMFTDFNTSLTTPLIFRTGVITELTATTADRVTSLAFFKPVYPMSVLPVDPLTDFNGVIKGNTIDLQWSLAPGGLLSSLTLQRSEGNGLFQDLKDYKISNGMGKLPLNQFSYSDAPASQTGNINYRLKMATEDGVSQYSNILSFQVADADQAFFRIDPTLISHTAMIKIASGSKGTGVLALEDYSGRVIQRQVLSLVEGSNNLSFNVPGNITPGNYLAVLRTNGKRYVQKLVIIR